MTLAAFIDRSRQDRERWKYTDLEALLQRQTPVVPLRKTPRERDEGNKASSIQIVFLNGEWQKDESDKCPYLKGSLKNGYTLTVDNAADIGFFFFTDKSAPKEIPLRFTVNVLEGGNLSLLENYLPTEVPVTVETRVTLARNATLHRGKFANAHIHLALHEVLLASSSKYEDFCLIRNTPLARNEIHVTFEGPNSSAKLDGIVLLHGNDHADTTTRIRHNAPECASRQTYRTILDGKAHGVFQGQVVVAKDAQKADGYQLSRALLLSDKAEMDAKPELQIFADDVKCSHGNTIGDLNEDALFYLRSRGLSERKARSLLIEGFVAEALDEIPNDRWRELFAREVKEGIK